MTCGGDQTQALIAAAEGEVGKALASAHQLGEAVAAATGLGNLAAADEHGRVAKVRRAAFVSGQGADRPVDHAAVEQFKQHIAFGQAHRVHRGTSVTWAS